MLSQPFQKLLVTEKWVWRPRGFEFFEESKLLVRTHRGSQNSHRAIEVQPSITRIWQASMPRLTGRLPSSDAVSFIRCTAHCAPIPAFKISFAVLACHHNP
jgi:hypothetical protein